MRLPEVCTRVRNSLADPVIRWKVMALMGGKMIGLGFVLAAMRVFIAPAVYAADGPTPEINALNTGLFYGGRTTQLAAQAIGSFSVTAATLVCAFVLMYAVKATGTLRVSKAGELEGLDLHEHGMLAYPEYVIHDYSPSLHHVAPAAPETMPKAVPSPSSA